MYVLEMARSTPHKCILYLLDALNLPTFILVSLKTFMFLLFCQPETKNTNSIFQKKIKKKSTIFLASHECVIPFSLAFETISFSHL